MCRSPFFRSSAHRYTISLVRARQSSNGSSFISDAAPHLMLSLFHHACVLDRLLSRQHSRYAFRIVFTWITSKIRKQPSRIQCTASLLSISIEESVRPHLPIVDFTFCNLAVATFHRRRRNPVHKFIFIFSPLRNLWSLSWHLCSVRSASAKETTRNLCSAKRSGFRTFPQPMRSFSRDN